MAINYMTMATKIMTKIQESPHKLKNDKTAANYAGHLKRIMKRLELSDENMFEKEHRERIVDYLGKKGASTRNQICCALKKYSIVLGVQEAIDFTAKQMELSIQLRNSEKEKKRIAQKKDDNWIDFAILKREFDIAYHCVSCRNTGKDKYTWRFQGRGHSLMKKDLERALYLGLFVSDIKMNLPRRAEDWTQMRITNKMPKQENDIHNYCLTVRGIPKTFVFYKYKTSGKYGRQEFPINDQLSFILRSWISFWKEVPGDYLIKKKDGKPMNSSQFGNLIDRIISQFGDEKTVKVNMLRNIVITEVYKGIETQTLKSMARACGHTFETACSNYIKANNLPPETILNEA